MEGKLYLSKVVERDRQKQETEAERGKKGQGVIEELRAQILTGVRMNRHVFPGSTGKK